MFIQLESQLLLRLGLGTLALRLAYRDNHAAPAARNANSGFRCVLGMIFEDFNHLSTLFWESLRGISQLDWSGANFSGTKLPQG